MAPSQDDVEQLSQVKANVLYLTKTVQKLLQESEAFEQGELTNLRTIIEDHEHKDQGECQENFNEHLQCPDRRKQRRNRRHLAQLDNLEAFQKQFGCEGHCKRMSHFKEMRQLEADTRQVMSLVDMQVRLKLLQMDKNDRLRESYQSNLNKLENIKKIMNNHLPFLSAPAQN